MIVHIWPKLKKLTFVIYSKDDWSILLSIPRCQTMVWSFSIQREYSLDIHIRQSYVSQSASQKHILLSQKKLPPEGSSFDDLGVVI